MRLLGGEDPATGEPLRQPLRSGAVAGFDLTFRAPKSVGVLFGICEPDVVREIVAAHEAAVLDALVYLERERAWHAVWGTPGGHKCQELRRSLGFVEVATTADRHPQTPAQSRKPANTNDAGGGTRTPDTRIMIPLL